MSRQHDREQLVAQLTRELPALSLYQVCELARKLRRAGATLQRLAEAQCNGDWPYDGPWRGQDRQVRLCAECCLNWADSTVKACPALDTRTKDQRRLDRTLGRAAHGMPKFCQVCRTESTVTKLLAEYGMRPIFDGDPRGPVLKVIPPSYAERNAGKDEFNLEGIYVS